MYAIMKVNGDFMIICFIVSPIIFFKFKFQIIFVNFWFCNDT